MRVRSKSLFLTYPNCAISQLCFVKILQKKFKKNLKEFAVCSETHLSSQRHIHAYVYLHKTNYKCLDIVFKGYRYHGNYQIAKKRENVIKYISKTKNFLTNIWNETKSNQAEVNQILIEKSPKELITSGNLRLFDLTNYLNNIGKYKKIILEETCHLSPFGQSFTLNFKTYKFLNEKRRHFWIQGPTNSGKTSFLKKLGKDYPHYFFDYSNNYQEILKNTHLVFLDEFIGQIPYQQLNLMCDNSFFYRPIYSSSYCLDSNPYIFVCSNLTMEEVYKGEFLQTVRSRFIEIFL